MLGADIAGRIEAVGSAVTQFKPGDEVFGVSIGNKGGFAEYARAAEDQLALKPTKLSFETAAAVPVAALTALQALRDAAKIRPGQRVLIYGASGGVGSFAVQIAKSPGAEVTAACSTWNLGMVRSIGADHVIDYMKEDFTQNGQRYEAILAVNGNRAIKGYQHSLCPGGTYAAVGGSLSQFFQALLLGPLLSRLGSKKLGCMGIAKVNHQDLVAVSTLLETGQVVPVIDRCNPLGETAEAIRYLVEEHAREKSLSRWNTANQ